MWPLELLQTLDIWILHIIVHDMTASMVKIRITLGIMFKSYSHHTILENYPDGRVFNL